MSAARLKRSPDKAISAGSVRVVDAITIQIVSFQMILLVAILGFLWNLHRDVAGLRECMIRVEALLEGLGARSQQSQS